MASERASCGFSPRIVVTRTTEPLFGSTWVSLVADRTHALPSPTSTWGKAYSGRGRSGVIDRICPVSASAWAREADSDSGTTLDEGEEPAAFSSSPETDATIATKATIAMTAAATPAMSARGR